MGLDMYLYARKSEYVSAYYKGSMKLAYPKELVKYFPEFDPANMKEGDFDNRSISKANHIHAWFVHNCGHDVDECQEIRVSEEALDALLKACKAVLEDHSKAEELLPTQSGFFFGGTDYDEYYFDDVKETLDIVERALAFIDSQEHKKADWEIVYQASW